MLTARFYELLFVVVAVAVRDDGLVEPSADVSRERHRAQSVQQSVHHDSVELPPVASEQFKRLAHGACGDNLVIATELFLVQGLDVLVVLDDQEFHGYPFVSTEDQMTFSTNRTTAASTVLPFGNSTRSIRNFKSLPLDRCRIMQAALISMSRIASWIGIASPFYGRRQSHAITLRSLSSIHSKNFFMILSKMSLTISITLLKKLPVS